MFNEKIANTFVWRIAFFARTMGFLERDGLGVKGFKDIANTFIETTSALLFRARTVKDLTRPTPTCFF